MLQLILASNAGSRHCRRQLVAQGDILKRRMSVPVQLSLFLTITNQMYNSLDLHTRMNRWEHSVRITVLFGGHCVWGIMPGLNYVKGTLRPDTQSARTNWIDTGKIWAHTAEQLNSLSSTSTSTICFSVV